MATQSVQIYPIPQAQQSPHGKEAPILSLSSYVLINCPAEKVFELFRDTSTWPAWNTFVPECGVNRSKDSKSSLPEAKLDSGDGMAMQVKMTADANLRAQGGVVTDRVDTPGEDDIFRIQWESKGMPKMMLRTLRTTEVVPIGPNECEFRTWEVMAGPLAYVVKNIPARRSGFICACAAICDHFHTSDPLHFAVETSWIPLNIPTKCETRMSCDVHLETFPSYSHYKHRLTDAPCLFLLGDIGHVASPQLFNLFTTLLDHHDFVFYLLGNHDPKDLTLEDAKSKVRSFEARMAAVSATRTIGKFVFLDQTRFDLDSETTVLGCTLFTHIEDAQKETISMRMVDFRDTKGWTVDQHNAAHSSDLAWLNSQVAAISHNEPLRRIAIMTHHSPSIDGRANDPRHEGSTGTSGFVTDLSKEVCWTSKSVSVWAFGHTHWNCDFIDEETGKRVFTNQRGYWKSQKESFDEDATCLLSDGRVFRSKALAEIDEDDQHAQTLSQSDFREESTKRIPGYRRLFQRWLTRDKKRP
ncbi:hypothetical protein FH972_023721 [Carpinus fangiana]|uniref:Uncharacterized protein n=1 Tax=Carpinus fangiana TaxID=176857 RepID=A0A5N6KWE7_9ROSI|nr:hypothetical protein FH972_023721 [Carpinus fangiana]